MSASAAAYRSLRGLALLLAIAGPSGCERSDSATNAAPAPAPASAPAPVPTPAPPSSAEPSPTPPPIRKDGTLYADSELMGTRVSINVWVGPPGTTDDDDAVAAGSAIRAAFDEMARLEQIMSEWRPDSELSRLSDDAGRAPRPLSPELLEVLLVSVQIARDTDGAFDPTFHGVGQLWSFAPGSAPPTPAQVRDKLDLVDWTHLELDASAGIGRLRTPGMKLGLGAIGKGFAADKASALLTGRDFPHHVVEVGGDTYAAGTKGGKPWMVGIQRPQTRGVVGAIPSQNRAVVTSGDYQRFFEHEGERYAHILDPRTGWPIPAKRSPKSVTLVASTATQADAYCTAVAVMGIDAGLEFVESRPAIDAVIITQDDEVRISSGLQDELVRPPTSPVAPTAPNLNEPRPRPASPREVRE